MKMVGLPTIEHIPHPEHPRCFSIKIETTFTMIDLIPFKILVEENETFTESVRQMTVAMNELSNIIKKLKPKGVKRSTHVAALEKFNRALKKGFGSYSGQYFERGRHNRFGRLMSNKLKKYKRHEPKRQTGFSSGTF